MFISKGIYVPYSIDDVTSLSGIGVRDPGPIQGSGDTDGLRPDEETQEACLPCSVWRHWRQT
jgi:hypothetical protein